MKKSFSDYALLAQRLKTVLHTDPGWINYDPIAAELLDKTVEFIAGAVTREGHGSWTELPNIVTLAASQGYLPSPKVAALQPNPAQAILRQTIPRQDVHIPNQEIHNQGIQAVQDALRSNDRT